MHVIAGSVEGRSSFKRCNTPNFDSQRLTANVSALKDFSENIV